jgi:glucose/arabinose dehydrogenase
MYRTATVKIATNRSNHVLTILTQPAKTGPKTDTNLQPANCLRIASPAKQNSRSLLELPSNVSDASGSKYSAISFAVCLWLLLAGSLAAEEPRPTEDDYYRLIRFPIPERIVLEAGALEFLPDGRLAIATRRGEIYFLDKPLTENPDDARFALFAGGLHEVLGLAWRDGWLYCVQRAEVTRMKDTNGDNRADVYQTVSDGWGLTGDYHEYAFGSKFDREGNLWVALCLTGSFSSDALFRGWCLRVTPEGKTIPTCSGLRSPGGVGANAAGDMFYTENQGPWNGACSLKWLKPGAFLGHPIGNKWYDDAAGAMGPRPKEPESGSRMMVEAKKIPELEPPAVYFPYGKMGQSAAGIACDLSGGKFGPFAEQLFVGDQTHSTVMRVFLEKVNGHYQGACFPFRGGLGSGSLSLQFAPDGSLFVGGTNRGWGSRGSQPYSLERLVWTGKTPFEVSQMRAKSDGFELTFTQPIDPATAADPASYSMSTYAYIYQSQYGSPEVDVTTPTITRVEIGANNRTVRLFIDKLEEGHVHELHLSGVRSATGQPLLHTVAYYTLNYLP